MQNFDEQLYALTKGVAGQMLETTLQKFNKQTLTSPIWGEMIFPSLFLTEEACVQRQLFEIVKTHWANLQLLSDELLEKAGVSLQVANERMRQFFSDSQNKQVLFHYTELKSELHFEHLVELVFGKSFNCSFRQSGLEKVYIHKIDHRYLIHPIYLENTAFWDELYAKKLYSIFMQIPLSEIEQSLTVMTTFRSALQRIVTKNRAATVLHKIIQQIDKGNPRSFELKQLHLLNIRTHFTSGRRHFLKLKKCILRLEQSWGTGPWALNEKEKTLLAYMLLHEAVVKKDRQQVIANGLFLIEEDRLHNHAVELVVEYSDVLNNMNPQPTALIKNYEANYLEYVFFALIDALVTSAQFDCAYELLRHYELATCEAIYQALHATEKMEQLHTIEATIQRDIALLVDGSMHHVRESIAEWLASYEEKTSPYFLVAKHSSKHVSNIMKILFVAEEDLILEKMMTVYKKYFKNEWHLTSLRCFIEQRVLVYD